ncbi:unnamed protein product, partial [Choristocarpus tenellus]
LHPLRHSLLLSVCKAFLIDQPVQGFAMNEEVRLKLTILYCDKVLGWELIFDLEAPERCPDLVPLPSTDAE